jgi:hypothetical protein
MDEMINRGRGGVFSRRRWLAAAGLGLGVALVHRPLQACMGSGPTARLPLQQWVPYLESIAHWPSTLDVTIGSVLGFLVPAQAQVEITPLSKGSMEPLVRVEPQIVDKVRLYPGFVPEPLVLNGDGGRYRWVYLHAQSYGKSQIRMTGPKGWQYAVTVGNVYPPAEQAVGRAPLALRLELEGEPPGIRVDAYDNIVLSVPGQVTDGWGLEGESGFRIARIETQDVPYGDPERVSLLLRNSRSPRSGLVKVLRGSGGGSGGSGRRVFSFQLEAMPTAKC